MKKKQRFMWGIVVIILGILLGLKSFNVINFNIFFNGWWTLFIIVPCLIGFIAGDNRLGNFLGVLIGLVLLLSASGVIDYDLVFKLIWPLILVVIGINMLYNSLVKKEVTNSSEVIFKSHNIDMKNKSLEDNSNYESIFGSLVLNLRNAKLKKENKITVTTIFGGVKIYVPEDVEIVIKSGTIFGSVNDKSGGSEKPTKKLVIDAKAIFGEITIL